MNYDSSHPLAPPSLFHPIFCTFGNVESSCSVAKAVKSPEGRSKSGSHSGSVKMRLDWIDNVELFPVQGGSLKKTRTGVLSGNPRLGEALK